MIPASTEMEEALDAASLPMGHDSKLCRSCKERAWSKEAWRKYWAQTSTEYRYAATSEELLVGRSSGCWLCSYICDKCMRDGYELHRTFDFTIAFTSPRDVQPRKINELQIVWRDSTKQSRIERFGISTTIGIIMLRPLLRSISGSY